MTTPPPFAHQLTLKLRRSRRPPVPNGPRCGPNDVPSTPPRPPHLMRLANRRLSINCLCCPAVVTARPVLDHCGPDEPVRGRVRTLRGATVAQNQARSGRALGRIEMACLCPNRSPQFGARRTQPTSRGGEGSSNGPALPAPPLHHRQCARAQAPSPSPGSPLILIAGAFCAGPTCSSSHAAGPKMRDRRPHATRSVQGSRSIC